MSSERKCACLHVDARACFLARHPECMRMSDDIGLMYDKAIDCDCECACHCEGDELLDGFMEQEWA